MDQPARVGAAFLHVEDHRSEVAPGPTGADTGAPVLVDRSCRRLPYAAEVLERGSPR